ncbi:MAG: shikimate dehydrogenase [Deltaproteobacteria bacterium]|nr:shikimate dehydrogenase [Deltaproteobacteria bacterium]
MRIDGKTRLYGIIGNPVSHSFSPKMQSEAFFESGINAVYLPFPVEEKALPHLLTFFDITKIHGFNVTVPYKEKILPFLDHLSTKAERLGSVNTVVKTDDGWIGHSTDGTGFIRSLEEKNFQFKGARVLILGAGGSAKAIAHALADVEISSLGIINRTANKADALAKDLILHKPDLNIQVNPRIPAPGYELLINCTSIGMIDDLCPISEDFIKASSFIVDIIYNPPLTPLLRQAQKHQIPSENGLDMLLYQGVEAFEIWTGQKAPVEAMKKSLLESLSKVFFDK